MSIQAILFNKEYYTKLESKNWLLQHEYYPIKPVHITKNYYRYRLRQPDKEKYHYMTKSFNPYIKVIIGFRN